MCRVSSLGVAPYASVRFDGEELKRADDLSLVVESTGEGCLFDGVFNRLCRKSETRDGYDITSSISVVVSSSCDHIEWSSAFCRRSSEELVREIGLGGRARALSELSSWAELSRDAGATGLGT
jgi:hypothetical protein